jgi:hypothetical protein
MIDENDEYMDISKLVKIECSLTPLPEGTKYSNKFLFGDPSREFFVSRELECDGVIYTNVELRDKGETE